MLGAGALPVRRKRRKVYQSSKVEVEFFCKEALAHAEGGDYSQHAGNGVNGIQSRMVIDKQVTLPSDMVSYSTVRYG